MMRKILCGEKATAPPYPQGLTPNPSPRGEGNLQGRGVISDRVK